MQMSNIPMALIKEQVPQHFMVVTLPAQGHINPSLRLAKQLARTTNSLVTFSTTISGHRRMFPSATVAADEDESPDLSYIPFSDGYDDGLDHGADFFFSQLKLTGTQTGTTIIADLSARGRPVTCIIYAILLPWVSDVARALSIPSVLYWIQPATAFAIYYHYFHGYDPSSHVRLPGLPPLKTRDLPSFVTVEDAHQVILSYLREQFENLDRDREGRVRVRVLVNTFKEAEESALVALENFDLIPIGPMVSDGDMDLMKHKEEEYMEWLDGKEEGSVVYVSFGTLAVLTKKQTEEIRLGLRESGRKYLWVLRKDSRWEGMEMEMEEGMVVEWCSQARVLSHPAVGCFVTHCGWNSTVESLVVGVPTVGVPQWSDQTTNAWLAEEVWGTGVRTEADGDGVVGGDELRRCLEVVMGEGERGVEIRRRAVVWRDRAREVVCDGGTSELNLKGFVERLQRI